MKQNIMELAEKEYDYIQRIGSAIWAYAELAREEYQSAYFLTRELEALGYFVQRGVAGFPASFIAQYKKGEKGPVIGLLCEYDALPGLSPDSLKRSGHGCGHNPGSTSIK